MRQYELAIRISQVHHLVDEKKYKKALAVIQTLDVRQVRSLSDLKAFAEVYTKTEQFEAAKATYLRIYRNSRTRRVLYRLIYLSIRTNALDDAETYYQEFLHMNPSARDVLILHYRLEKAKGAPMGQLIDILQELKQEEYIEEWAYELAKLYHRAGRRQECLEECEDILLWFGTGEIVERAKILIDHLQEKNPAPYYDDRDFTIPRAEEANPDDTGPLPDIKGFAKERKIQKQGEEKPLRKEEKDEDDGFIDDYEEDDFEQDGLDLSQKAKGGIQKLSVFWKHGKKEEESPIVKEADELEDDIVLEPEQGLERGEEPGKGFGSQHLQQEKMEYTPHSQSGTGITQDLAREISAIYEMEHGNQLREKSVKVFNQTPAPAEARPSKPAANPEEVRSSKPDLNSEAGNPQRPAKRSSKRDAQNLATNVVDRMTQAIQKSASRGYIPLDIEEIRRTGGETQEELEEDFDDISYGQKSDTDILRDLLEEEIEDSEMEEADPAVPEGRWETGITGEMAEALLAEIPEEETLPEEPEAVVLSEEPEPEETGMLPGETEPEEAGMLPGETEPEEAGMLPGETEPEETGMLPGESEPEEVGVLSEESGVSQEETESTETGMLPEEPFTDIPDAEGASVEETEKETAQEEKAKMAGSPLENYQAPDIPLVQTNYMEMPEITFEDLPTTRALQQSFKNVLRLIEGELDPSHFVLMGDGTERIVGVSKQIVRVMKETGYLSKGRIAKINSEQLNAMDLISFQGQLKGNCLLIENAADLLFPTITKIFSIMEEYYGDFVVILADEGTTLDQLFRFVPVLAKKFKYIIDISKYSEEDYKDV